MAAKRAKRFAVVVELNQAELDQIAQQLAEQEQRLLQERAKYQQLEDYKNDYFASINAVASTNIQALQRQRSFVERMDVACRQQQGLIDELQTQRQSVVELWQQQQQKVEKLQELLQQYQQQEQREADIAEQKMIDDLVTQRRGSNGL
ncbi:MAG: flagellar export protein FliJ [Cellvibrionaceae bacterium]|nr:flagellar export protein FliJ [Cellvibrionaceae bacterium]